MNKSFMLGLTGSPKPAKRAEGRVCLTLESERENPITSMTIYGNTHCTYRQGYPNTGTTYHLGASYKNMEGLYVRIRQRSDTFMDGDEFERLVRISAPNLIDQPAEDGRIVTKSYSTMPSFFITPNYMRSEYKVYTVFMDIAPESAVSSTLYTNMAFYHQNRSYIEWLAKSNGLESVSIHTTSSGISLYGISNTSNYNTTNRFFIDRNTFLIGEGNLATRPTDLPPTAGEDVLIPIPQPLRGVKGNDGEEYSDTLHVTSGKLDCMVQVMKVNKNSNIELVKPDDGSSVYFRVKLPTPIVNGAVDTNMFATLKNYSDFAGRNNIGYVDGDGEYYCFKIYASTTTLSSVRNLLDSKAFEIYWYDGSITRQSCTPMEVPCAKGRRTMEVCSYVDAKIEVEYL